MKTPRDERRDLPSVGQLLEDDSVGSLPFPRSVIVRAAREAVEAVRAGSAPVPAAWSAEVARRSAALATPTLRPVLNATGVVLHTNLGRAPLAHDAIAAVAAVAQGYSALELDLPSGSRGSRAEHCRVLLQEITGAEDALVVNNAAGALVLALNAAAAGRDVLLSRGELIEIGGSFRIPEILEKSGARLVEVGTTNRTHLDDYRTALSESTGAILTVHRSNFELRGYVASPAPRDLAGLAREHGIPYLYDVGSGLVADLAPFGLVDEPRVPDAVATADVVVFSGDKLLGGPQAGCLTGRAESIRAARANPLARALRADKLTLAALGATLALYRDPALAQREIPVLAMLTASPVELEDRARTLLGLIPAMARALTAAGSSAVGGGAFPEAHLPTTLVVLDPPELEAGLLARRLRTGDPPVVTRIADGKVTLDPRTLPADSLARVGAAVAAALAAT